MAKPIMLSIEQMVEAIYATEENFKIQMFWDAGFEFEIGNDPRKEPEGSFGTYNFREGIEWIYRVVVLKEEY